MSANGEAVGDPHPGVEVGKLPETSEDDVWLKELLGTKQSMQMNEEAEQFATLPKKGNADSHLKGISSESYVTQSSMLNTASHAQNYDLHDMNMVSKILADNDEDIDKEVDSFLRNFSSHHDSIQCDENDNSNQLLAPKAPNIVSIRQWVKESKDASSTMIPNELLVYIKSEALPIALKLVEVLIVDTDTSHEVNVYQSMIPTTGNIFVEIEHEGHVEVLIDNLMSMGSEDDACQVKSKYPAFQLYSLGVVLYELFAREEPPTSIGTDFSTPNENSSLSIDSINLNNHGPDSDGVSHPSKKIQRFNSVSSDYLSSHCISMMIVMEGLGIPYSIRTLVGNLLDCGRGDLCGINAYTSLDDVKSDLQLMLDDPTRFVDNIATNPLPSLTVSDKLFGRQNEIQKVVQSFQQNINGVCSGTVITGKAGVGKSVLARHVEKLSIRQNGYFLVAKYDQNKHVKPMSTVRALFNSLCEMFVRDASSSQLHLAKRALEGTLGNQVSLLAEVLPSFTQLLSPSFSGHGGSLDDCVNSTATMQFLFGELLNVLASHSSRHITLVLDDLQCKRDKSLFVSVRLIFRYTHPRLFFNVTFMIDNIANRG